jgi:hypothetical protein
MSLAAWAGGQEQPGAVREVDGYPVVLWSKDFRHIEQRVSAIEGALERPWNIARRVLFNE